MVLDDLPDHYGEVHRRLRVEALFALCQREESLDETLGAFGCAEQLGPDFGDPCGRGIGQADLQGRPLDGQGRAQFVGGVGGRPLPGPALGRPEEV
ncbi:hypothetical protein GCM10010121_081690 [Streptomyces brasiliensis]|uniref:Uncharacterized protein n=1 Tax=Streptomyces brasiliensis TaxID=1954 RepID=A0A917LE98_9ACTN|nr:hypothetical protein GCM10010121_081690 [Streptomyces brasiliensis]